MNLKCKRFTYGLLALLISSNIFSVVAAEPEVYEEEEVVVTATRTSQTQLESPGMTEVITEEEIQASGAKILSEVLTDAGLNVSSSGADANIQIDGSSPQQTLVLINGVSANTNTLGLLNINSFPASIIKKVEVVHGPLSALYGANALGGVANIITDLTGAPENNIELSGGTFDTKLVNATIQQEKWGFSLGGNTSDGYRDNSAADLKYFAGQYDFLQGKEEYLTLNLLMREKSGGSPGDITAELAEANYSLNLSGKNQWLNGSWEYKLFRQYSKYDYKDAYGDTTHETNDYGLDLAGLYLLAEHELLTGIVLKHEDFESTISNQHTRRSGGLFFQDTWHLAKQWRLVSGVRWDTASGYSSPLSPRASLIYLPSANLSFKFGYGKAFRAPTVNDLYWDQPSIYGNMYGNENLKPERAERFDLVGEWRSGSQVFVANVFHADVKDEIDWMAIDPSDPYSDWIVNNINKVKIDGITIQWTKNWSNHFTLKTGYNYLEKEGWNETTQSYSDPLNPLGKNQFFLDFGFIFSKLKFNLNWQRFADRQQETVSLADYGLLNLSTTYTMNENIGLKLTIRNLTNEEYQIQNNYPMPGREVILGINTTF